MKHTIYVAETTEDVYYSVDTPIQKEMIDWPITRECITRMTVDDLCDFLARKSYYKAELLNNLLNTHGFSSQ